MRIRSTAMAVLLLVAGCGSDDGSDDSTTTAAVPTGSEVSIAAFRFQPADVEVAVGTTVRWANDEDAVAHTTTGDGWDSGTLEPGESFEFTFSEAGTFDYVCTIHPSMQGTVTVAP